MWQKNKQQEEALVVLRDKLNNTYEKLHIESNYRYIVNNIVNAYLSNMPFIPFSDWVQKLEIAYYTETHSKEQQKLILSLKADLKNIAKSYGYTTEDDKGFLLSENLFKEKKAKDEEKGNPALNEKLKRELAVIKAYEIKYGTDEFTIMDALMERNGFFGNWSTDIIGETWNEIEQMAYKLVDEIDNYINK